MSEARKPHNHGNAAVFHGHVQQPAGWRPGGTARCHAVTPRPPYLVGLRFAICFGRMLISVRSLNGEHGIGNNAPFASIQRLSDKIELC